MRSAMSITNRGIQQLFTDREKRQGRPDQGRTQCKQISESAGGPSSNKPIRENQIGNVSPLPGRPMDLNAFEYWSCGEKGHYSNSCPKNQGAWQVARFQTSEFGHPRNC